MRVLSLTELQTKILDTLLEELLRSEDDESGNAKYWLGSKFRETHRTDRQVFELWQIKNRLDQTERS